MGSPRLCPFECILLLFCLTQFQSLASAFIRKVAYHRAYEEVSVPSRRQPAGPQDWQCNYAYLFFPNGTGVPPPGPYSWGSRGRTSSFQPGPCLLISGFHVAETYAKTIINLDRSDSNNSYFYLPGGGVAYAEEITLGAADVSAARRYGGQRALDPLTNTFCSTGQLDAGGNLISIAGSTGPYPDYSDAAYYSVRSFTPCYDGTCGFKIVAQLSSRRWYPSSQILPDARILIVGGSNSSTYMAYDNVNNPTIEYYTPGQKGNDPPSIRLDFLARTAPYNLYPFVHLLPSGRLFIFASQSYILFDTVTNAEVPGKYPVLDVSDAAGSPFYRNYPVAGSSALFPVTSAEGFQAEIIICGGNSRRAAPPDRSKADPTIPADDRCWRISPEVENPAWIAEPMCLDPPTCTRTVPRVQGDLVLLPDGSILIINGAQAGYQGIPNGNTNAALQPLLYLTQSHSWYTTPLAVSRVQRGYHSIALLLHDGTVWISGSNPNQPSSLEAYPFATEFRTELFYAPYFYGPPQPIITDAPYAIPINTFFKVTVSTTQGGALQDPGRFQGVLAYPGFSTHGHRHGMRNVVLELRSVTVLGPGTLQFIFASPKSLNLCPPTQYWFFVLDNGIPCKEATPMWITGYPSP